MPTSAAAFLAGRRPGRTRPVMLALVAILSVGVVALSVVPAWLPLGGRFVAVVVVATMLPWFAGRFWRQYQELVRAGWERAGQLEREQRLVAGQARLRERARIDAVGLVRRHRPTVAVLDIRMPGINGIEAAAEIRSTVPATSVIMLTTFGEDDYILQALGGGASGFLIKSGEPEELITGVRAVAEGAAYLSPKVAARVVAHLSATGAGALAGRRAAGPDRARGRGVRTAGGSGTG